MLKYGDNKDEEAFEASEKSLDSSPNLKLTRVNPWIRRIFVCVFPVLWLLSVYWGFKAGVYLSERQKQRQRYTTALTAHFTSDGTVEGN